MRRGQPQAPGAPSKAESCQASGSSRQLPPARFLDELTVRMPTADETRALRLPPGTPVAILLRTYRDPTGRPFEVAQFVFAGDKHILIYEGRPSTSA
ncbi:MAG TPA: UTRA domain-containing protein [Candidatus Binatia bacterium]|nr:UTRA domain-containing protein [Candidatus Binatia bacterium]